MLGLTFPACIEYCILAPAFAVNMNDSACGRSFFVEHMGERVPPTGDSSFRKGMDWYCRLRVGYLIALRLEGRDST